MVDTELLVWDRNAIPGAQKGRLHTVIIAMSKGGEVMETKSYELFADRDGTRMPYEHGIHFLVDPAFVVRSEKTGEQVKPVPVQTRGPLAELEPDQVIARFDELHRDALYQRAKMLAGSEGIKANATKEQLIDFIKLAAERRKAPSNENAKLAEKLGTSMEGMDERGLDTIMPPSPLVASVNRAADAQAGA